MIQEKSRNNLEHRKKRITVLGALQKPGSSNLSIRVPRRACEGTNNWASFSGFESAGLAGVGPKKLHSWQVPKWFYCYWLGTHTLKNTDVNEESSPHRVSDKSWNGSSCFEGVGGKREGLLGVRCSLCTENAHVSVSSSCKLLRVSPSCVPSSLSKMSTACRAIKESKYVGLFFPELCHLGENSPKAQTKLCPQMVFFSPAPPTLLLCKSTIFIKSTLNTHVLLSSLLTMTTTLPLAIKAVGHYRHNFVWHVIMGCRVRLPESLWYFLSQLVWGA